MNIKYVTHTEKINIFELNCASDKAGIRTLNSGQQALCSGFWEEDLTEVEKKPLSITAPSLTATIIIH